MRTLAITLTCLLLASAHAAISPAIARGSLRACEPDWTPPIILATFTEDKITVDAALSETAWSSAAKEDVITSLHSRDGRPMPLLAVECRLLRDSANLYLGVRCKNPEPQPDAPTTAGEAAALQGSRLAFCFDVEQDGQSFLMFTVNARGQTADSRVEVRPDGSRSESFSYASAWQAASVTGDDAWTVEAAIPLAALLTRPVRNSGALGFNLVRYPAESRQAGFWSARSGALRPDGFGVLALETTAPFAWLGAPRGSAATLYVANPSAEERALPLSISTRGQKESTFTTEKVTVTARQCNACPIALPPAAPASVEVLLGSDAPSPPLFQ
ncbi:MAG TPA: hypothetical protein P5137_17295, partial [Candidatus Brocadiia bacterium]|nr:hypothetical protein [Candidatus Brocadiia bacterium]